MSIFEYCTTNRSSAVVLHDVHMAVYLSERNFHPVSYKILRLFVRQLWRISYLSFPVSRLVRFIHSVICGVYTFCVDNLEVTPLQQSCVCICLDYCNVSLVSATLHMSWLYWNAILTGLPASDIGAHVTCFMWQQEWFSTSNHVTMWLPYSHCQ